MKSIYTTLFTLLTATSLMAGSIKAGTQLVQTAYSFTDNTTGNGFVAASPLPINFQSSYIPSQVTNIFTTSNKTITVDFSSDVKDNVSIQLINMSGQVIVHNNYNQASYRLIVNAMSAGSGVYVVRVSDSKGWSEVKKIAL